MLAKLDALKKEWGLRKRGDLIERLLELVLLGQEQDAPEEDESPPSSFHERGALVLVSRDSQAELAFDFALDDSPWLGADGPVGPRSSQSVRTPPAGIDLPGFVRSQTAQVKRSLNPPPKTSHGPESLVLVQGRELEDALRAAEEHWINLYGQPANAAVLEAAMVWLAQDLWRQSDLGEGRPFSWSLTEQIVREFAPAWTPCEPSFARVVVAAGLLEDPFSADTLTLRIPTLIRRFVHRFRRRPRGTSFQALENTLTLHGALKLLKLPTAAGHRLTLAAIREAYREQAVSHHPDAGGSVETMRRLNEAYQLLKELYRQTA
ncbi:molecular chaperone DnaJ [Cyanobium sp. Morenito 9A2]|nr:molecular chaperone DnaJ [Cyanobium sp. Morenito 9A2]